MSRAKKHNKSVKPHKKNYTACLVFSTGESFFGSGFGSEGIKVGELCFNTSMTGYQEILTDLSYAGQIVNFTFPHIGNTGTNTEDNESKSPAALGMICRNLPTGASNWRSEESFIHWLQKHKIIGIEQIDTRRITRLVRLSGAQSVALAYSKTGELDIKAMLDLAKKR
jgi:carbamoyl-phosphate synthase small subunit